MKNFIVRIKKMHGWFMFVVLAFSSFNAKSAEFVLMNRIISWDMNSQDAFWTVMPDATMPANWASPNDYLNGLIYSRYEIISVATNTPCAVGWGFFQWKDTQRTICGELCEVAPSISGNGAIGFKTSSPSGWWKTDGGVDFSKIGDMQSMGPIIYSKNPGAGDGWPVGKAGQGGDPGGVAWNDRSKWFPITLRVTVIAVSAGSTFSGWDTYIINPTLRQPTPDYEIDFINETTDKVVPSTDQFSIYSGMSYAIDGTGNKMPITPGQDANFRTKAGSGLLISLTQHFRAPCRPATPTFVLDKVNHRTTTVVSSDFEYSDNADMSGATTGDGTNVAIPAGTTKYFQKKATLSSFRSKVQALGETTPLPIAHELLIFNDTIDYPNTTDSNGFYYFYYNADMPVNWKSPEDYYYGEVYTRYEILGQKTEEPIGLQFGLWQMSPPETGELHETMSVMGYMNGTGSVVTTHSSPSTWWKLDGGFDYARMDLTWHMGINPWKVDLSNNYNLQIRQENNSVWAERNTKWFPLKVSVTIVAVAADQTFSGWDNYINTNPGAKKPMPTISIDYANQKTANVIPSTVEYSINDNMSKAFNGSGQALELTPGQDVYFRTKAGNGLYASDIRHLVVPARPAAPEFTIDWNGETTLQTVSTDIEYSDSASFASLYNGTGAKIRVGPDRNIYFRKKAGATAFTSGVYHLVSPSRPAAPVFTIDYANERTVEDVSAGIYYSKSSSYTDPMGGTGSKMVLTPGQDLYLWLNATASSFASLDYHLVVPNRPQTPSVTIDFINERTSALSAATEWSQNAAMSPATQGTNNAVTITPGTDLYFRTKAGATQFKSEIQHLVIPYRPAGPVFTIDYETKTTVESVGANMIYALNGNLSDPHFGTGNPIAVEPGQDVYFKQTAESNLFSSTITHLTVPATNYLGYSGNDTITQKKFMVYAIVVDGSTAFSLDDLQITNGTAQNLKPGNVFDVIPDTTGTVTIVIPENTTKENSFASNTITVYYDEPEIIVPTGIQDLKKEVFIVFPNPSIDRRITVQVPFANADQLDIFSIDGSFIKNIVMNRSEYQTIDLQELQKGMYLLKIRTDEGVSFQKVILE
jgi:hypothetical protein